MKSRPENGGCLGVVVGRAADADDKKHGSVVNNLYLSLRTKTPHTDIIRIRDGHFVVGRIVILHALKFSLKTTLPR